MGGKSQSLRIGGELPAIGLLEPGLGALVGDLPDERDIVRKWVGTLDDDVLDYYAPIGDSVSHEAMRRITSSPNAPADDVLPPPE